MSLEFLKSRIVYCLLVFLHPSLRDSFFRTQCKVHIPYISHESRYSPRPEKGLVSVSSRTLEGLVLVSSRKVWQTSRSRLGLGSSGLGLGLGLDPEGLGPIPEGNSSNPAHRVINIKICYVHNVLHLHNRQIKTHSTTIDLQFLILEFAQIFKLEEGHHSQKPPLGTSPRDKSQPSAAWPQPLSSKKKTRKF